MTEDDARQRELAVIEAARWGRKECFGIADNEQIPAWAIEISRALENLDALTTPQPVDPQTLPVGTKFQWPPTIDATGTYQIIDISLWKGKAERGYLSGYVVCGFTKGDRVIPLPDDTE